MVGAFIDQRFSLGTNNQGLFVAWNAELWPGLSYKNWRDDGGFAFGVRPGFSLGYEGSLEDLHISAALNGGLTWTFGTGDDIQQRTLSRALLDVDCGGEYRDRR